MDKMIKVGVYGDSLLKGIQIHPENKKYYVNNNINLDMLSDKYSIEIANYSSFGCTVTKGRKVLLKGLERHGSIDAIVMDYGGNDCDYNWREIAAKPDGVFLPNTPMAVFKETYVDIIETLKKKGILPILTTLPPLEPLNFFNWFCKDLNKKNILSWLGEIKNIYYHQEKYSNVVKEIADEQQVPLIDLRNSFLSAGNINSLLCEDGTHPNTSGQKVIGAAFDQFANRLLYR